MDNIGDDFASDEVTLRPHNLTKPAKEVAQDCEEGLQRYASKLGDKKLAYLCHAAFHEAFVFLNEAEARGLRVDFEPDIQHETKAGSRSKRSTHIFTLAIGKDLLR